MSEKIYIVGCNTPPTCAKYEMSVRDRKALILQLNFPLISISRCHMYQRDWENHRDAELWHYESEIRAEGCRDLWATLDNRRSTALSKVCGMIESSASTSCDDGQVAHVDCAIVNILMSKRAQERLQSANISTRDLRLLANKMAHSSSAID